MKKIDDGDGNYWWVPECDTHWERIHRKTNKPMINKYQYGIIETAYKYVQNFNLVIDCGANVGTHTKKFAENFKSVISYEPAPDCFQCLKQNTKELLNVILKEKAVGNYTGIASLDSGFTENTGNRQVKTEVNKLSNRLEINIVKLDDDVNISYLSLIKLDVQGFETSAILGAEHIIKISKPVIICEVEEKNKLPYLHCDPIDAINLLKKWGYRIRKIINVDYIMIWNDR